MRLSFIGWTPQPRAGKSKLSAILYRWLLVCNPLQLSRGQVCQVSAPGLFSAQHAGAHAAGDPSLCVSQSLGVSQFGPALCAAHRLSGRRDEYDAFQYDELPVKHCILVSHRRQRWRKYVSSVAAFASRSNKSAIPCATSPKTSRTPMMRLSATYLPARLRFSPHTAQDVG